MNINLLFLSVTVVEVKPAAALPEMAASPACVSSRNTT
jgi:hypothetical protein